VDYIKVYLIIVAITTIKVKRELGVVSFLLLNCLKVKKLGYRYDYISVGDTMDQIETRKCHIDNLSFENFKNLLLQCDDENGHHQLWVSPDGYVYITQGLIGNAKFYYESWNSGHGYVGKEAVNNGNYTTWLHNIILNDWKNGELGKVLR
jgi:hypothetical protein